MALDGPPPYDLLLVPRREKRESTTGSGTIPDTVEEKPHEAGAIAVGMSAELVVATDKDIVAARRKGRQLAAQLGLSALDATLIATAISELARNILLYAHHGEILLGVEHGRPPAFVIEARDQGPGIANPEQAIRDGYSTSGGLGMGLPGTRRIIDEMQIFTQPGQGTRVIAKKRLPHVVELPAALAAGLQPSRIAD